MIFARTKRTVQRVADDLADRGFAAAAVHGDLGQGAREQALRAFRSGKVDVLVATDVAARGIDVTDVTHVVNYQCPEDAKTYVHRIGRTGRAGQDRRRGDPRRLGRAPQVEDDQRRPRARHAGGAGDLLHLAAPLQRPRDPRRRQGPPAALAAHPGGPGRRVRRHRGRPRRAPAPRPRHASAAAATTQRRPTRRGRRVSARPGPAAAAVCCSGRTGRRSEAALTGVDAAGTDTESVAVDAARERPGPTVRTPTRPSPAGVAAVVVPGAGAVPATPMRESAPADSAPDAAAS